MFCWFCLCPQCARRADLLASIKSKAYGQAAAVCASVVLTTETCCSVVLRRVKNLVLSQPSKARRHLQVELSAGGRDHTPVAQKLSLKARTKRDVHISGTAVEGPQTYRHTFSLFQTEISRARCCFQGTVGKKRKQGLRSNSSPPWTLSVPVSI